MHNWTANEVATIKAAWSSDEGRRALVLIVETLAGLQADIYDDNPIRMARLAGRRSLGVDLMHAINLPIEKLVKEPHEPRTDRIPTATERANAAVGGGTPIAAARARIKR